MKWQPPVKAPYLHTGGSKDGALDLSLAVAWLPDTCSIYQIEENIIDWLIEFSQDMSGLRRINTQLNGSVKGRAGAVAMCNHYKRTAAMPEDLWNL